MNKYERDLAIVEARNQGLTFKEISHRFNVGLFTVQAAIARYEPPPEDLKNITDWHDYPIKFTSLSARVKHCMSNENIATLGEAAEKTDAELLHICNFGPISLKELREFIQKVNK